MMASLTVPLITLPVGQHVFGPITVGGTFNNVTVSVDRTVANGLDTAPSTTTFSFLMEHSPDGGVTWHPTIAGGPFAGGTELADGHVNHTDTVTADWTPPWTGNRVRVTTTVTGGSVAIAGSIVAS